MEKEAFELFQEVVDFLALTLSSGWGMAALLAIILFLAARHILKLYATINAIRQEQIEDYRQLNPALRRVATAQQATVETTQTLAAFVDRRAPRNLQ